MNDYDLGSDHGYENKTNKYPNNANYCEGYKMGQYARAYKPVHEHDEGDFLDIESSNY